MNECTCAHPHATVGTVKWQHTQQHSAHCDKRYVRLYVFACASVRVSWFIVCVRGVFCESECVECGSVVSVAATWVERALCSLSVFTIYSVMCARFLTVFSVRFFGFFLASVRVQTRERSSEDSERKTLSSACLCVKKGR